MKNFWLPVVAIFSLAACQKEIVPDFIAHRDSEMPDAKEEEQIISRMWIILNGLRSEVSKKGFPQST